MASEWALYTFYSLQQLVFGLLSVNIPSSNDMLIVFDTECYRYNVTVILSLKQSVL